MKTALMSVNVQSSQTSWTGEGIIEIKALDSTGLSSCLVAIWIFCLFVLILPKNLHSNSNCAPG